jgi:hypothetical protein
MFIRIIPLYRFTLAQQVGSSRYSLTVFFRARHRSPCFLIMHLVFFIIYQVPGYLAEAIIAFT